MHRYFWPGFFAGLSILQHNYIRLHRKLSFIRLAPVEDGLLASVSPKTLPIDWIIIHISWGKANSSPFVRRLFDPGSDAMHCSCTIGNRKARKQDIWFCFAISLHRSLYIYWDRILKIQFLWTSEPNSWILSYQVREFTSSCKICQSSGFYRFFLNLR